MPTNPVMVPDNVLYPSQVEAVRDYLEQLVAARRSKQAEPQGQLSHAEQEWVSRLVSKTTVADAESALHAITTLSHKAPIFEIGFARQPSPEVVASIGTWFRRQVNPLILVRVTIQPGLIGGLTVRTARHTYDLSVAASLSRGHQTLQEVIHAW